MVRRICLWMLIGIMVACCWAIVAALAGPTYNLGRWAVVGITALRHLSGGRCRLTYFGLFSSMAVCMQLLGSQSNRYVATPFPLKSPHTSSRRLLGTHAALFNPASSGSSSATMSDAS
jgi:hypothetical protein